MNTGRSEAADEREERRALTAANHLDKMGELASLMERFDAVYTATFERAAPQDRARMAEITSRFDPCLIAHELREWSEEQG